MRIALVHGNDGSDVRAGKVCRSLSKMGFDVHFIGWERTPHIRKKVDIGNVQRHILELKTKYGRGTIAGYLRFGMHIAATLRRLRPDVCIAVNEDQAMLVLPFKGIYYKYLVIDVFDALADRHDGRSRLLVAILQTIQKTTRRYADRLIATDERRYERFGGFRKKTTIIQNYPEDPGESLWADLPTGLTKIYVAGALSSSRGLQQIIEVANRNSELRIVSAGMPRDDYVANVFVNHPQVEYMGVVTARESLLHAAKCDAVLCLYEPNSTNTLFASPNKVYDALSVGRPIIVNSETALADWIVEEGIGYSCPYEDIDALNKIVMYLPKAREKMAETGRHARELFVSQYTWESMEERLGKIYRGLMANI